MPAPAHPFVVVANRLPVDLSVDDGTETWRRSPGGLVTALHPVASEHGGAWVGWTGTASEEGEPPRAPFDHDGIRLVPVALTAQDVAEYYEGFANDTLWPLCHDVISPPEYHRVWWDRYRRVNDHFARATAAIAAAGATVWVQDYQLMLVPRLLRELRPDLRIGYFHHIPFPPVEIFAQLPWRRQVLEGLLGADLIGLQRTGDASNLLRCVRRLLDLPTRGPVVHLPGTGPGAGAGSGAGARRDPADGSGAAPAGRRVQVRAFPISIDSGRFDALARTPEVRERARQIRAELGDPSVVLLGVDRLDYTKGIRHRIKAYGELLAEGRLTVPDAVLVQVASPSRENVGAYQQLREEVEVLVGRINGEHADIGSVAVSYLHHSYPAEEMAALYLAADVMLVTSLRDGMNLVAKEYVAARTDGTGVLVLSEFTGAADQLGAALLVNPHDIDGLKDAVERAVTMPEREARLRMRRLRRRVLTDDVAGWARSFLTALGGVGAPGPGGVDVGPGEMPDAVGPGGVDAAGPGAGFGQVAAPGPGELPDVAVSGTGSGGGVAGS